MSVLIVTQSQDVETVTAVTRALEARGGTAFRFDTDRFPTEVQAAVRYEQSTEQMTLHANGHAIDLTEVTAVWQRRFNGGGKIPSDLDPQIRYTCVVESQRALWGMLVSLPAFHLDPVAQVRLVEHKQLQLRVARRLGLRVPRTLITNHPNAVRAFKSDCPDGLVTKMLEPCLIPTKSGSKGVFTTTLASDDFEHLDGLQLCPMVFQERVPKRLELRVTIVGQRVFTAAVDSQAIDGAEVDWRREPERVIEAWERYTLPDDVERRLLTLMNRFGLNYGAIDLILTPDDRYAFLEVNPGGQYLWIENHLSLPISEAIADVLLAGPSSSIP